MACDLQKVNLDVLWFIETAMVREQKAAAVALVARAPQQPIRAQKLYLHLSSSEQLHGRTWLILLVSPPQPRLSTS